MNGMSYQRGSFTLPVSEAKPRENCTHGWRDQKGRCMWCGDRIAVSHVDIKPGPGVPMSPDERREFLQAAAKDRIVIDGNTFDEIPDGGFEVVRPNADGDRIRIKEPYRSRHPLDCEEAEVLSIETVAPRDVVFAHNIFEALAEPGWISNPPHPWQEPSKPPAPDPIGPQEGV